MGDELTLLLVVGSDTPSNIRISPAGAPAEQIPAVSQLENMEALDFNVLVRTLDRHAIPGVKDKISATMLTTPVSTSSGAYMLKIDPRDHPHLVANEALHLTAVTKSGLPVAGHQFVHDSKGTEGLLVERFDRIVDLVTGVPIRLPLQDGRQVLNLPPARKYSVSAEQVIDALASHCQAPVLARRNLYIQFLYAWLTGNGDLHGKNVSILADRRGKFSVSPIYDIPCTLLYGDGTLALSVAGKIKNLKRKHWQELGQSLKLPSKALASANEVALRAAQSVDLGSLPFEGSPIRGDTA